MLKKLNVVILLAILLLVRTAAIATEAEKNELLNSFTTAAKDNLGEKDLELLSKVITDVYDKYKFSDDDVSKLGSSSVNLVLVVSEFTDKLSESPESAQPPKSEVKGFFTELGSFLSKYKVTGEDTLQLGKAVTTVAMSVQQDLGESGKAKSSQTTKEDMDKIFTKLSDFSRKHNIQAADLAPIMYQLSDIGLSVVQSDAINKKTAEKGGSKKLGVSGDQIVSLVSSLTGFGKKYKIELGEMLQLADDIRLILKK